MSDLRVPDLNMVMIAGRLTRDPELKYTAGNRAYCRFGIANTRYYKTRDGEKREETVFASCSVWDKQAEWIGERIKKGRPVLIEGSLNSYEVSAHTDADGQRKAQTRLEIRARRVTPLDWDDKAQQPLSTVGLGPVAKAIVEQVNEAQPPQAQRPIEEPIPEDDGLF